MKKRYKIMLSIILPIMCITSLCISFLMISNDNKVEKVEKEKVSFNKTKYEANYFALADETSPAQGQSTSYKGGAVFLEPDSKFIMLGGTLQNHSNTYGGGVYISSGATFTMDGGTITGCSATYGGAIYVEAGGTCIINGGTITGNTASYGPSIYAEEGASININASTVIDKNSVVLNRQISISTDTVLVGNPSSNFSLHYVDFGSYPQWYVGDTMNNNLESWYGTNNPTSVNTYVVNTRTWEAYQYTDGNIYARGLSYPYQTGYYYLNGTRVKSNASIVWFKVEPIRWVILNYDAYINARESELELMSYCALTSDIKFYSNYIDPDGIDGTSDDPNQWVNSDLRKWLNGPFYESAFSGDEQCLIATTTVKNNKTGDYETSTSDGSGIETEDKVYCLSYWDFCNPNGLFGNLSPKRLCSPTDFTLSNYCYKYSTNSYPTAIYPSGGTCDYWTRSAGSSALSNCDVYTGGRVSNETKVTDPGSGVRPVLRLMA